MRTRVVTALTLALAAAPGSASATAHAQPAPVKEFTLVARPTEMRLASGQTAPAWGYNGQVPGPEIRVKEGDRVRITFKNELPVPSTVHWHGVDVPWTMDGPPGVNQKPVNPGETFVYEFVAKPAGTRFYHTHGSGQRDEAVQMDMGLYGAFIIERADEPTYDREYTMILSERPAALAGGPGGPAAAGGGHGAPTAAASVAGDSFFINGKAWPMVEPLRVKPGERVRIRMINAGSMSIHPMHLHGHSVRIIAADGYPLPAGIRRDVVPVLPGERYDVEFVADNPGVWLFHCHELHHMDAGMAMLVQYEGYQPVGAGEPPAGTSPGAPAGGHGGGPGPAPSGGQGVGH